MVLQVALWPPPTSPVSAGVARTANAHSAISPQRHTQDSSEPHNDEHGAPAAGASREHPAGAEQPRAAHKQRERGADIDSNATTASQRATAARFALPARSSVVSYCALHCAACDGESGPYLTQRMVLPKCVRAAQEEIATAQDSKAKLCETIGSLQQAKEERENEIKQLELELKASRESQSTLMKKMHRLEGETREMKRGYIK